MRDMRFSRRRVLAVLATAAGALLAACGQATPTPAKPAEPAKPADKPAAAPAATKPPEKPAEKPAAAAQVSALPALSKAPVTVRVMAGWPLAPGGPHPVTKKQMEPLETPMAKFAEQFPNIKIQWSVIPTQGMWEKMGTDLVAKGNDVYYANSHDYMPGGPIELLDPWIERDTYPVDEFFPIFAKSLYAYTRDVGDQERRYYSTPLLLGSGPLIFYDREIFANYGVEPPSEFPTPEEILDKSKKLTGKDPKTGRQTYGFYLPSKLGEFHWVALMNSYGGELFDDFEDPKKAIVTQEAGKKTMAWWIEMAKYAGPNVVNHGQDLNSAPEFLTPQNPYAMGVGVPAVAVATAAVGLEKKIGAIQYFKNKEGKGGNPGGIGLMMHRNSSVKAESWELMKFLNSEEMHRWRWTNWAFFSTRKVSQNWPDVKEEPLYTTSLRALESGKFMPTKRIVKWRVAIMPHVQAAITDQKTGDQALQDMERELTEIVSAPGP